MLTGRRRQQQAIVQVVNAIMTEYKLTQLTLAARCGLPKSTLSDYLTGKHTVSIELVGRLLNVFPTYTAQIVAALAGTRYSGRVVVVNASPSRLTGRKERQREEAQADQEYAWYAVGNEPLGVAATS